MNSKPTSREPDHLSLLTRDREGAPKVDQSDRSLFGRGVWRWSLDHYIRALLILSLLQFGLHTLVFVDRFSPTLPHFLG